MAEQDLIPAARGAVDAFNASDASHVCSKG
jgi:hypothetical protein